MSRFEHQKDSDRFRENGDRDFKDSQNFNRVELYEQKFECNVTAAASEDLTRRGILPSLDIEDGGKHKSNYGQQKKDSFERLDSNNDKQVTAKEWVDRFDKIAGQDQKVGANEFNKSMDSNDSAKVFKQADADGDSELSVTEWLRLFQNLEGHDKNFTIDREEFARLRRPRGDGSDSYGPAPRPDIPVPRIPADPRLPTVPGPGGRDRPAPPSDRPALPGDQPTNPGEIPKATPQQVEQLFSRVINRGASDRYLQELKQSPGQLPSAVVQAAIDGGTRIVAVGQGPPGLGGTYNSGSNTVTMYETSPFNTTATLSAEMFHNWDLNPRVGKHISSQPWFQDAFRRARASGINLGDNTLNNPFEFIHHMARHYTGVPTAADNRLMNFLGSDYRRRTMQALLS